MNRLRLHCVSAFCLLAAIPSGAEDPVRGPEARLHLALDGSAASADGLGPQSFTRASTATRFDEGSGKLVDVPAHQVRFERRGGKPWGSATGVLIEGPAGNLFRNSSFEAGLAHWSAKGGDAVSAVADAAIHGDGGLVFSRRGTILQEAGVLLEPGADGKKVFAALSIYARRTTTGPAGQRIEQVVQPVARTAEGGNRIRDPRVVALGRTGWVRVSGRFEATLPGEEWKCGFEIQAPGIRVDAAQLETTRTASAVSSFIPTGDEPARREVEDLVYPASGRLRPGGGTLALWYYMTNPYDEFYYLFAHGPFDRANRLHLAKHGGVVGVSSCRWLDAFTHGRWTHVAITWDGEKAVLYADGKEAGDEEGAFPYERWTDVDSHWRVGGNGLPVMAAQGLIADLQFFDVPLAKHQVDQLARTGRPGAIADVEPAFEGMPVMFETPVDGTTSVALYDKEGVQLRELLIGAQLEAGRHSVPWDGRDREGVLVRAGEYEVRGSVANLEVHYEFSVGNSGDPPWDWERNIHAGLFVDVAVGAEGAFYVASQTGEGNRHLQKLGPDGQVVWTSPISPCSGPITACAADERYFYAVTTVDSERDAATSLVRPREAVWRLSAETGTLVPWPDGTTLPVNGHREATEDGITPHRWILALHNIPPRHSGVAGMAAGGGRLYVPLRFENAIAVYDRDSGAHRYRIEDVTEPLGLAMGASGRLFVVSDGRIIAMDRDGGNRQTIAGELESPWDVAVTSEGVIHVSDHGDRHQVRRFDRDGRELDAIGVPRNGMRGGRVEPDRLVLPMGIAVDDEGHTFVADLGNGRVQRYDREGQATLTVLAGGFGGNNGGVAVMPGEPERFFVSVGTPLGRSLTEYRLDYQKKTWRLVGNWPAISPIKTVEPLFIRKIEGRTYLFLLSKNITVFELRGEQVEFCTALVCGPAWGVWDLRSEGLRDDARELDLLDAGGRFNCRFAWTDGNRDRRMQPGEVMRGPAQSLYTVNDADVDADGDIVVHDHYTASIFRFPRLGFDDAGNPRYSWDNMETLWSLWGEPAYNGLDYWVTDLKLMGTRIDGEDNLYISDVPGPNWTDPMRVSIRKIAPDGRVLWDVGRKARGLKDRPGEFQTVSSLCGLHKGLVFINEIEGQVDVYTGDGLYAATLLENYKWGSPGPYVNWGENFFSTVYTHPETGADYLIINPHFFHFPCYRIDGIDDLQRFGGSVALTDDWRAKLASVAGDAGEGKDADDATRTMRILRMRVPPAIDGALPEWRWMIPESAHIAEAEDRTGARGWAGYDAEHLYLAFDVNDPTPAVNAAESGALWSGDALEAYLSTEPERFTDRGSLREGDYVVHIACTTNTALPRIELNELGAGRNWVPEGARLAVVTREDGSGYLLEAAIPWDAVEPGWRPQPGGQVVWDWSMSYSDPAGSSAAFKASWTPETGGANWRTTAGWDAAHFEAFDRTIRRAAGDTTVDADDRDWPEAPRLPIEVEEVGDRYAADVRWSYDDSHLYLAADVRDPDPGLSEAGTANLFFSGDSITLHAGGPSETRKFVIIAHRGGKTGVYDAGTVARIESSEATFTAWPDEKGYTLEASIPWNEIPDVGIAAGAPLRLQWKIAWSDALGGEQAFERTWGEGDARAACFVLE